MAMINAIIYGYLLTMGILSLGMISLQTWAFTYNISTYSPNTYDLIVFIMFIVIHIIITGASLLKAMYIRDYYAQHPESNFIELFMYAMKVGSFATLMPSLMTGIFGIVYYIPGIEDNIPYEQVVVWRITITYIYLYNIQYFAIIILVSNWIISRRPQVSIEQGRIEIVLRQAHPIDEMCSICHEMMNDPELLQDPSMIIVKLPDCDHCYHRKCITEWLVISNTCPLCRGRNGQLVQAQTAEIQPMQQTQTIDTSPTIENTPINPFGNTIEMDGIN